MSTYPFMGQAAFLWVIVQHGQLCAPSRKISGHFMMYCIRGKISADLLFIYERLQAGAANTVSIPPAQFDACYISDQTNAILEAARQETFAVLGQEWATPTVMVNGFAC